MQDKIFISKLKDNTCLVWSNQKTKSNKFILLLHYNIFNDFKSNYQYFKIDNNIYKFTDNKKIIKLNF